MSNKVESGLKQLMNVRLEKVAALKEKASIPLVNAMKSLTTSKNCSIIKKNLSKVKKKSKLPGDCSPNVVKVRLVSLTLLT